ncbi:MAG: hypothetical protein ACP5JG_10005 [Anaerolineae bacterium]
MIAKFKTRSPMVLLSLLGGLLTVVALLWFATDGHANVISSPMSRGQKVLDSLPAAELPAELNHVTSPRGFSMITAEIAQITCTLETTTTDKAPVDNHTFNTAAAIANYTDQALVEGNENDSRTPRPDFYRLDNATVGAKYTVQAKPDWTNNYNLGIIVYNADRVPIITDTDTFNNNFGSVTLVPDNFGPYYFKVFQISEQCSGHTYSLILGRTDPTATPSPTPTQTPTPGPTSAPAPQPTWMTGFDQYEPNFDFNIATTIAPGITYDMNFIPWGGGDVDNDFLKVRVKPGLRLTCETSDLDPGVDPRVAIYSGPGEEHFITANDDIQLGNFNSRVSYFATFEGYVYILIGQGQRMSTRDTVNSDYTFSCSLGVSGIPTPGAPATQPPDKEPAPTPRPTATPRTSPIATPTPTADTEAEVELTFRLVASPEPVAPTAEPNGFRTFRVLVYYDENMDAEMGAGEGVVGFFVLVLTPDGSEELAQGYTDEQGQLSFTVPTVGTVRVLVPLLGFDRLIEASRPEVRVRILPPVLPETIP